jgi:hypothetical protein
MNEIGVRDELCDCEREKSLNQNKSKFFNDALHETERWVENRVRV